MARRGNTGKIKMPFWRGVPPKSVNAININSINAIKVGFVTTLILVVLFIIGIVIAFAKVETQAPTAHTERMPESPLYLTVTTDLTLWLGNEAIGRDILPTALDAATKGERDTRVFFACGQLSILWRSHGGHEPPVQGRIPEGRVGRAGENASSDQPGSI
jgi:hypothetical protein